MKTLFTLFKIEWTLSVREFSGVLFGMILPVGVMLLLGALYQDQLVEGQSYTLVQQAFPAVMTIGICATGLMGLPITISNYRDKKILKRFMVTPTRPIQLLMAQFLNQMVFAIVSSLMVFMVAKVFFDYKMVGNLSEFLIGYFVVLITVYSIGMLIASISKNLNMSNLLTSLVYFPMFFLSGTTIPYEIMPKPLQFVSDLLPLTHGVALLKSVSLGSPLFNLWTTITGLLILSIICMIIATSTFKYEYRT